MTSMQPGSGSPPPLKRARRAPSPVSQDPSNGLRSQPSSHGGSSLPPMSLSILGVEPLDEFIKEIADFIHHMIMTRKEEQHLHGAVEVEAKIGIIRDRNSGQRLSFPVLVETILSPDFNEMRFESNMSVHQHRHYNNLLNKLKTESTQSSHPSSPLDYRHLYLVDSFYAMDGNEREKVRVTRDDRTGDVLETMRKVRLGDLNIYSPKQAADWRISVNVEVPMPHPIGSPTHTRRKDRLSYSHEEFHIDLTQVTSSTSPNAPPQIFYELELEIARPQLLVDTAIKRGDPKVSDFERSAFDELIRAFVNNARILVRNSSDGWQ